MAKFAVAYQLPGEVEKGRYHLHDTFYDSFPMACAAAVESIGQVTVFERLADGYWSAQTPAGKAWVEQE